MAAGCAVAASAVITTYTTWTAVMHHTHCHCGVTTLSQVRYSESHPNVLSAAAKLGGGKAQPALELVGYEAQVEAAIKYAFGSAFVCQVRCLQYSCEVQYRTRAVPLLRTESKGGRHEEHGNCCGVGDVAALAL